MAKSKRKAKKRAKTPDYNEASEDSDDKEIDIDYLTTDPNSPLAHMDLIAEFSSPEFRALLTDQDKIEIADLLPDHVRLTEEGFFHDEYIRYDMDFRNGIRLFQQDLAEGKHDPEWLRQAAQAMEQRAAGDFDKWKEQEFEEFWGQKQRLDPKARAGQSGTIKLNRLVEAGLFKEGDIFSYMRVFGRGKSKVTVEKDVKIIDIDGITMTYAIPPGQRKYARRLAPEKHEEERTQKERKMEDSAIESNLGDCKPTDEVLAQSGIAEATPAINDFFDNEVGDDKSSGDQTGCGEPMGTLREGDMAQQHLKVETTDEGVAGDSNAQVIDTNCIVEDDGGRAAASINTACTALDKLDGPHSPASSSSQLSDIPADVNDVVLVSVSTLQALEDKIVEIDGRLKKKPDGHAFKNIRVKRNNQDLGSLFEIREEWYVYKK